MFSKKTLSFPFVRYHRGGVASLLGLFLLIVLSLYSDTAHASPPKAAIASLSISAPSQVFIGSTFDVEITFDNTDPLDTGYGPFIDLILPFNGADGAAGTDTPDGIDFVSATYLGQTLSAQEFSFPTSGCINHPLARDTNNNALQVCGTPADKLVIIQLPFGSFTPNQPAAEITITASLSNFADIDVPLNLLARGGFQYGNDALNNPCCDASILTPPSPDGTGWPTAPITPILLDLTKTISQFSDGDTDESVTGPNFAGEYTITLDIADGQTITDLDLTDSLPPNIAFLGIVSTTPAGIPVTLPPIGTATAAPNNQLVVNFPSVTGTAAEDDVVLVWQYLVPEFDANGDPILDPATGTPSLAENYAEGIGDWQPGDPRDSGGSDNAISPGGAAPAHGLFLHALALQKNVAIVNDTGATGASPGDTLQYTLQFELSDYFTFGDLQIEDVFSDGQRLNNAYTPTFTITDRSGNFAGTFTLGTDFTVDTSAIGNDPNPATDGSTRLNFDISSVLITAGDDGVLQGGRAVLPDAGPATGIITYQTVIQEAFSDTYPSGGSNLDLGDLLDNSATLDGTIRDNQNIANVRGQRSESSSAELQIVRGLLDKDVYAINNTPCAPCNSIVVAAGDTITYRIQYSLPTSDFDDLSFTDYLPLPVFNAASITTFDPTVSAAIPPTGTAKFGPANTLFALAGIVPSISSDAANNTLSFDFGRFGDPANTSTQIDILFTATILNNPFASGLNLSNLVRANTGTTNAPADNDDAIVSLQISQPHLAIRKGVVATSNPNASLTLPLPIGITFAPPGSSTAPFSGLINSSTLALSDIDSDLNGASTGDLVSFAIVIENMGANGEGAFDIRVRDTLTPGFLIPTDGAGLNLKVTRGNGDSISYTPLGPNNNANDLFGTGIELIDPSAAEGVCQSYDPSSGANIVIVTYDLRIDPSAATNALISNLGEITQYSNQDGAGVNLVSDAQIYRDSANVGVGSAIQAGGFDISLSKIGVLAEEGLGLVGESVTWMIRIQNNSQVLGTNIVITDTIAPYLNLVDAQINRGTVSISGQTVTFSIPLLGAGESIEARVSTIIQDLPTDGVLSNTISLTATGADGVNINRSTSAVVRSILGLPSTGYPPDEEADILSQIQRWEGLWEAVSIIGLALLLMFIKRRF